MKELNVKLENCFGIEKLDYTFDFGDNHVFAIYARNGLMKTSFAKTFLRIRQGKVKEIRDEIFGEAGTADVKIDGKIIGKDDVYVIQSLDTSFTSDISPLLVNDELKMQLNDVFEKRTNFLNLLANQSGLKIARTSGKKKIEELEPAIISDFSFHERSILLNLGNLDSTESEYDGYDVRYSEIFSDSVLKKITSKKFQDNIKQFIARADEVYSSYGFLSKGGYTLPKLKNLQDN